MATEISVQDDMTSYTLTAASASGNSWDNSTGQVFLWVANFSGGNVTVTVAETRTCSFGHTAQDFTGVVPNNFRLALGPFDIMRFNDSSRKATATFSDTTSVTIAAVQA